MNDICKFPLMIETMSKHDFSAQLVFMISARVTGTGTGFRIVNLGNRLQNLSRWVRSEWVSV